MDEPAAYKFSVRSGGAVVVKTPPDMTLEEAHDAVEWLDFLKGSIIRRFTPRAAPATPGTSEGEPDET